MVGRPTGADEAWRAAAARQFDGIAAGWRQNMERVESRADRVLAAAAFAPGGLVLDAGCGSGNWSLALVRRGFRVRGVDISPAMIVAAREEAQARGLDAVTVAFAEGPIERIAAPDGAFDGALCLNVLDFTPQPGAGVAELLRVMRPGGRLALGTLGAHSPVRRDWWRRFLPGGDPSGPTTCNGILPWETAALLRHFGWRVVDEFPMLGPSNAGVDNAYDAAQAEALADPILQQTVASSWIIIAERP